MIVSFLSICRFVKDEVDVVIMLAFDQFRCITLLFSLAKATYCLKITYPVNFLP